ncbi:hypothetical protein K474DRAFT_1614400 [Panus rudis PR-1116 ss-1]|nr:hypothetical protein K474DRAFT_1614400 [Panus rudis PR-1116 ss-1]
MICELCSMVAKKKCSGCQAWYCSEKCQRFDWVVRTHKKDCKAYQVKRKKLLEDIANMPPPMDIIDEDRCTGCRLEFTLERCLDDICPHCNYRCCKPCSTHKVRGTCYCPNGNFGQMYCKWEPRRHHANGRTGEVYTGDRHPTNKGPYPKELYESTPQACNNCGQVTLLFKKKYLKPWYGW